MTNEILNALNELFANRVVVVPVNLTQPIIDAAAHVFKGTCICGGYYNAETQTRVLYVA